MQGRLTEFCILFLCPLDGEQFNLSRSCGERANAGTRRRNGAGSLFGENGNGKQNGGNT